MKKIFILSMIIGNYCIAHSQNVGIGTTTPNTSAQLDITSVSKGLLIPRMNTTGIVSIANPAKGLIVYDSSTNRLMVNMGNASIPDWQAVVINCGWSLLGNKNTNPTVHFIGTTDNNPLQLRLNNKYAGVIDSVNANAFLGYNAGADNINGRSNVAIGQKAFAQNTGGYQNTVAGDSVVFSDTAGCYNTIIGYGSFYSNKNSFGSKNTAIGTSALFFSNGATENTAIGYGVLSSANTYSFNTATGNNASFSNSYHNTAIGTTAPAGQYSTVAGSSAGGAANSTGIGAFCLRGGSTADFNTAAGYSALTFNSTGGNNTANGSRALYSEDNSSGTTANGYAALYHDNGAGNGSHDNTATGSEALYTNSSGYFNTATGRQALYSNLVGYQNTGIGASALYKGNGISNTGIGYEAMYLTSNANLNVAIGEQSMYLNTGFQNTSINYSLLLTSATHNTIAGYNSGVSYSLGDNNSMLGANCDVSGVNYFNCIAIGEAVTCTASNQARFGNSFTTSIGGYVNWSNISDGRFKKHMLEDVKGLDFIMRLKPVTYRLDIRSISGELNESRGKLTDTSSLTAIEEKEKKAFTGFVAQQVEAAARQVNYDFSGINKPTNPADLYGLRYDDFVVPLVKAMQEQQLLIRELKKKNEELTNLNDQQEELYKKILKKIERLEGSSRISKN